MSSGLSVLSAPWLHSAGLPFILLGKSLLSVFFMGSSPEHLFL